MTLFRRRTVVKPKTARTLLGAALTLYFLWVAALAGLVVMSRH